MSVDLIHAAIADAEAALAKAKSLVSELFGEAEQDAEQVAATAATSGLDAAATQAVGDTKTLVADAAADIAGSGAPGAAATTTAADVTTPPASA